MVTVIGGGLAGCEAALQLASRGVPVRLIEMRPLTSTPIHQSDDLAELVCSNSFKSTSIESAAGLLKYELAALGSQLLGYAFSCRVPAGGALAVDRGMFSCAVTDAVSENPLIEVVRDEVTSLSSFVDTDQRVIVAAGPLCSDALAADIASLVGAESLSFFDAAAPIVEASSLDMGTLFRQSRHDRGGADYLNAPFSHEGYDAFIEALLDADRVIVRDFENRELFSACQPIEQIARAGHDAPRFGPLKPVGLIDPATGHRPWAAVQLRNENRVCSAYNLVGFQTNLTFGEQERVFRMIPGLSHATFLRFGVMHRNTFIDAPHVLGPSFEVPTSPNIRFAGQICGTEGYMEAVASGLIAALDTYADISGLPRPVPPATTSLGSLIAYATDPATEDYQPMHVNFGLFESLDDPIRKKAQRYAAFSRRARGDIDSFVAGRFDLAFRQWEGPDIVEVSEASGRRRG